MSRIVFLNMNGDDQVELRMGGDLTWMDVTDRFLQFLRGCGYQVTTADVADYLNEMVRPETESVEMPNTCCAVKTDQEYPTITISTFNNLYNQSEGFPSGIVTSTIPTSDTLYTVTPVSASQYEFEDLNKAVNSWFTTENK